MIIATFGAGPGRSVSAAGEVFAATLPAGRYVAYSHTGHPERLVGVTASILEWGAGEGLEWDMTETGEGQRWACRLEIFKTHPLEVPDPNDWITDVAMKLRTADQARSRTA